MGPEPSLLAKMRDIPPVPKVASRAPSGMYRIAAAAADETVPAAKDEE